MVIYRQTDRMLKVRSQSTYRDMGYEDRDKQVFRIYTFWAPIDQNMIMRFLSNAHLLFSSANSLKLKATYSNFH
jgi:hypothetical protein